jgi:Uma2 family endonuclease
MSPPAHRIHVTRAEFIAFEASSNVKHEYLDGQIYAMAGGTPEHAALAAAATGLLFAQLRGSRCRAYNADLRVRSSATGLTTYPDVTIVCGPVVRDPEDPHAITNPRVIVEVLSRSAEAYDRGDKFEHYQTIASLQQYVLIAHGERAIEVWTRTDDGWQCARAADGEVAALTAIDAHLDVGALYQAAAAPDA